MILNATYLSRRGRLVKAVVRKQASYEEALEAAFDVFKVPEYLRPGLTLRCRLEYSAKGTKWMIIGPAVWNEIVDDMELLFGFYTSLKP
ncbi:hypothetical protein BYT27DRAFT_7186571 [Phlegmacium glaucopus]|nr:hypothetical protein BYT27DRAFT_7186571 [Phlegmacium glaucopus]